MQEEDKFQDLELPADFSEYDTELQTKICQYLRQLTPIEKQAYCIAKEHLGSSFSLIHCNGFIQFLNNKKS